MMYNCGPTYDEQSALIVQGLEHGQSHLSEVFQSLTKG